MKYLILTFYYKPDLCAGSFRNTAFISEFKKNISPQDSVEVITTLPNRYHTFNIDAKEYEKEEKNIEIFRIKISAHKSGLIDQVFSFIDYYKNVSRLTKNKKYNAIFASSSRLFTAFIGAKISRKLNIPLYLDIRDIFSETISQVIKNRFLSKIISFFILRIEHYTIKSASHLNLVSPGFGPYFKNIYNGPISFFTNGIDPEFYSVKFNKEEFNSKKNILYAGNIGEGQGLEKIVPYVAKELGDNYFIKIVGDGGTKEILSRAIKNLSLENVEIEKPVEREELIKLYSQADFLFLHLNNYPAFEKVLPSKIFEYAATNKPIIAGVSGFPKSFIENEIPDAIVFEPCNYIEMSNKVKSYDFPIINRTVFLNNYDRRTQMASMAKSFIKLIKKI